MAQKAPVVLDKHPGFAHDLKNFSHSYPAKYGTPPANTKKPSKSVSETDEPENEKSITELEYYTQSAVFRDLVPVEQKLDLTQAYSAIEEAFDKRTISYTQAADFRSKISCLLDTYSQRYKYQKHLQEIVTEQVRYYQDHYAEVHEAETLPWIIKQQLQGLRGDAHRLNDELVRAKDHLEHLEQDIHKLEEEKHHLNETLELIPTAHEYQQFARAMSLEQQLVQQQLDGYGNIIARTEESRQENALIITKIAERHQSLLGELTARQAELHTIVNFIPHIQRDCGALTSEFQKCGDEMHATRSNRHRLDQHLQVLNNNIEEARTEYEMTTAEKNEVANKLEEKLYDFKETARAMEEQEQLEGHHRNEKAALEEELNHVHAAFKVDQTRRLHILRERDFQTGKRLVLEVEIKKIANSNENDRENWQRLEKKAAEKEEKMKEFRDELDKLENAIDAFGTENQSKKDKITALRRQKRERRKRVFYSLIEYRQKVQELRILRDKKYHLEVDQRLFNAECGKNRHASHSLNEESEHKAVLLRYLESVVHAKKEQHTRLQEDSFKTEKDRQNLQDKCRVTNGLVHQHKELFNFLEEELKHVEDAYKKVVTSLEKTRNDRKDDLISLQRLRKMHLTERQRLQELSYKQEQSYSKVLLLRRELDVNLLRCETFTDTFELVSELRACEAALFIDITTQFMLKFVEKNQTERQIYETQLRHRALDAYINWLHITADVDIKLLYKRLKWRSELLYKYTATRDDLRDQLIKAMVRRSELSKALTEVRQEELEYLKSQTLTDDEIRELQNKEEKLTHMLITKERLLFSESIRYSLLNAVCEETSANVQKWRNGITTVQTAAMVQRNQLNRAEKRKKLALLDAAAMKTKLCNELVLAENLKEAHKLTTERTKLLALESGDSHGIFQVPERQKTRPLERPSVETRTFTFGFQKTF